MRKIAHVITYDPHELDLPKITNLDVDPDSKPCLWQLYTPEQDQEKDPNMYLWVRRCELFTSPTRALEHLNNLGIVFNYNHFKPHELFPELYELVDERGYKWYLCRAPIHV